MIIDQLKPVSKVWRVIFLQNMNEVGTSGAGRD